MDDDRVAYEPVSVKDVLAEMKDTAELLIDLSYSAVLFGSDAIAEEVLDLESQMEVLHLKARMSLLLAARNPSDAESLAPVLAVVGAAEKISDAAGDIAKVVLEDIGLPEAMRAALPEAIEAIERASVVSGSKYADRTLGEVTLETETGVRVIAVRRNGEWLLNPGPETALRAADVVILRGPREGLSEVYETMTDETYVPPDPPEAPSQDLERAVDSIVLMKNMSELAVDLAYGSVLFDSEPVAEEVLELEAEVDALQSRFEAWVLRAASRTDDPVNLRGLVQLGRATEVISDAALEISEGVLRGIGTHPVVAAAVEESDEVIVRFTVDPDSRLAGRTLGDAAVKTETGMRVIAVRHTGRESRRTGREGSDWVVSPGATTEIEAGDVLLAKGTRTGADRLADLVGE
ncbi:PhoU-like domain fused to TrkA-C domain [Halapricum desulfuricans]|uniref:PhoU-like domain fused to TrkA-C domain n=1 Tax=Halapricum desulfuricans TaxID=2841257 RepID=A0A897NEC0_9EURY|nr:potassium channel family protein [Halapricum desulfuricans]QSG10888.1 PhoU-like domain fused to TrkA-C domain [Halapricum desulfuricans]